MSGEIPHTCLMTAALAMAENEGVPLNQTLLNETELILQAAHCPEDGCLLPRGHDTDCSPTLIRFAADRVKLAEALATMLDVLAATDLAESPVWSACDATLKEHGQLDG
jgi:hypothetical protein